MFLDTRILGWTDLAVGMIGVGTEHLTTNRQNMDTQLDPLHSPGGNGICAPSEGYISSVPR